MIKKLIGLILFIVVIIILAIFLSRSQSTVVSEKAVVYTPPASQTNAFAWKFEDKGTDGATGAPLTVVTLSLNAKDYPLGTYLGSCAVVEGSSWQLLRNEQSGAICYFAGAGTELGVFSENGGLAIKKGSLDEGDDTTPGTRGNFTTVLTVK